jgi:cytochrome c oxidase cbb3-type subunit 2
LTVIPNWQIGHLNPQSDEEGTDIYPMPQSGMVTRGARVYAANGCIYCHSQQVRAEYAGADIERKWGDRRSAPRDYIFERPVFLGKMRMGQDIANIGARAPAEQESPAPASSPATQGAAASPWPEQTRGLPPMYSAAWHHVHLYSPRSINLDSNMPSYRFLYRARRITDARSTDSLKLTGSDAPPEGWEIIPTFDARCLIAYLMARNQSHPLKEVRSAAPAAGGSPVPSPAPGGQPAK